MSLGWPGNASEVPPEELEEVSGESVLTSFKTGTVFPVPKKSTVSNLNNYYPVTPRPILIKSFSWFFSTSNGPFPLVPTRLNSNDLTDSAFVRFVSITWYLVPVEEEPCFGHFSRRYSPFPFAAHMLQLIRLIMTALPFFALAGLRVCERGGTSGCSDPGICPEYKVTSIKRLACLYIQIGSRGKQLTLWLCPRIQVFALAHMLSVCMYFISLYFINNCHQSDVQSTTGVDMHKHCCTVTDKHRFLLVKFSDDSAVVGLITDGDDREYRGLIQDFADWCLRNNLQINAGKTKELVVDFRRRSSTLSACTGPALLIHHDRLPTLTAMIHFLVRRKEHGAVGFNAGVELKHSWTQSSMRHRQVNTADQYNKHTVRKYCEADDFTRTAVSKGGDDDGAMKRGEEPSVSHTGSRTPNTGGARR
ncbi:hypothetical protein L3Q82_005875 [Scortum barcoo]|uniref:Uncharacterized protein n=1 Tax=Scortum barcoo TaxID=214431 RepID=A0ACB8V6U2_9TELE|nr:hypothetical protein L3Q82_005875 [Scortum barcoo]